jgi:hypothetical protein
MTTSAYTVRTLKDIEHQLRDIYTNAGLSPEAREELRVALEHLRRVVWQSIYARHIGQ